MKKHALLKLTLVLILLISAFSFTACQKTEVSQENTLEIKNVYQDPIGNVHLVLESVDVFDSTKGKDLEIKFGENAWEGYYYGLYSKDLVIKSYYDDNLNNLISQTVEINIRISGYTYKNNIYLASDPLPQGYSYKIKQSFAFTNESINPNIKAVSSSDVFDNEIYTDLISGVNQIELEDDSSLKYNVYDGNQLIAEETYKYLVYYYNNWIFIKEIELTYSEGKIIANFNEIDNGVFKIAASKVSSEDLSDPNGAFEYEKTYQWSNINSIGGASKDYATCVPSQNTDEDNDEILSFFIMKIGNEDCLDLYYNESFRIYF